MFKDARDGYSGIAPVLLFPTRAGACESCTRSQLPNACGPSNEANSALELLLVAVNSELVYSTSGRLDEVTLKM